MEGGGEREREREREGSLRKRLKLYYSKLKTMHDKHLVCFIEEQLCAELQRSADLSILCIPLHQGVPSLVRLIGRDFP